MQKRKDRRFKQWSKTVIKAGPLGANLNGGSEINAYTYDLSLSGARLHAKERFAPGTVLHLTIELIRSRETLRVAGEVKWVRHNEADHVYEMGIEFLHSSSQSIMSLMKDLHNVRL